MIKRLTSVDPQFSFLQSTLHERMREEKVFTYRLCRTRLICAAQSQLFQGECAGVSAGGKHNIVFSRSHPQPQHLTSFDLKFASTSLPPVRIETFLGLYRCESGKQGDQGQPPPPRITSSFVSHIPARRNMIYRLRTFFPIFSCASIS